MLTVGVVLAVYFASSGVDSLRIGLNRAYNVTETRSMWLLKLESIGYVLVAAFALLALGFLIVLAPLVFATALKYAPWLVRCRSAQFTYTALRHRRHRDRDRAGRRAQMAARRPAPLRDIAPGVIVTLVLWLAGGILFGRYLAEFAINYVTIMRASPRR